MSRTSRARDPDHERHLALRPAERRPGAEPAYVLTPCLVRPRSRGSVRLASADPLDPPLIDPGFLAEPHDLDVLVRAIVIAREIGAASELADWRKREVYPGPGATDRRGLRDFARRAAEFLPSPRRHLPDGHRRAAVVDPALRVRGIQGLRVVDASVMPSLPQAMVNAATIAIAERGSDLIRSGG